MKRPLLNSHILGAKRMSESSTSSKIGMIMLGLTLAFGMVTSTLIATRSAENIAQKSQRITVKGLAEKNVKADLAVWRPIVNVRGSNLQDAYARLQENVSAFKHFLKSHGIEDKNIKRGSMQSAPIYQMLPNGNQSNEIIGYSLDLPFEITSKKVETISSLYDEAGDLVREGIGIGGQVPQYYVSQIEEVKFSLLAEATKNARQRAEEFAKSSQVKVGNLRAATQGVFQIVPQNSTETADFGLYDTTTIDKTVKVVVSAEYGIVDQ